MGVMSLTRRSQPLSDSQVCVRERAWVCVVPAHLAHPQTPRRAVGWEARLWRGLQWSLLRGRSTQPESWPHRLMLPKHRPCSLAWRKDVLFWLPLSRGRGDHCERGFCVCMLESVSQKRRQGCSEPVNIVINFNICVNTLLMLFPSILSHFLMRPQSHAKPYPDPDHCPHVSHSSAVKDSKSV